MTSRTCEAINKQLNQIKPRQPIQQKRSELNKSARDPKQAQPSTKGLMTSKIIPNLSDPSGVTYT